MFEDSWAHIVDYGEIIFGKISKYINKEYIDREYIYSFNMETDLFYIDRQWYKDKISKGKKTVGFSENDIFEDKRECQQNLIVNIFRRL